MINRRNILLVIPLLLITAMPAFADRKEELQARFRARFEALEKLRHDGTLGETFDGWVAAVKDKELTESTKKLMDDENADRKELYGIIAKEENTTADKVARRNALRNYRNGKSGDWFKMESGEWKQKP